jgi:hypothetical protein
MATATRTTFGPQVSSDVDIGSRYGSFANTINFGIPETSKSSHGFSIPVVEFKFKSAFGTDITGGSPILRIRAPSSLSLQHNSNYERGGNIFGGSVDMGFNGATKEGANASFSFLGQTGNTLAEAIARKIIGAAGEKIGYFESAGQSGIDQFEFANRSVINPFSQLLYKGPNFKQYNLPFVMRPKNINEARAAMGIISAFKIASSPKVASGMYEDVDALRDPSVFGTITNAIVDSIPLTFGYPDLVSFEIYMYSGTEISEPIYTSLNCAIMSVSTDYGQQKMSFFIPDSGENKYYPTEIAMTIGLQEVEFRTTYDAEQEVTSNTTLR